MALCYASPEQCRTEPQILLYNRGITRTTFVSDQYSGFHGIVIPGTLRDSYLLCWKVFWNRRPG
ncbi:hypothetical protein [Klebsiella pneumoniae]|uniref:hypothetical protein n=1 Tax=Klebsiella pneumoniae TaxID=573 RepID=UPI00388EB8A4